MTRFVVALPSEARPLIERFRLKGHGSGPFRLYRSEARDEGLERWLPERWLIVSGIGKTASAAAAAYLHAVSGEVPNRPWLNVGIGGHGEREVGEAVLLHRITDAGSGRRWYPPRTFPAPCATAAGRTVDRPEQGYPEDEVYDMEASGFVDAAGRCATAELVHSFKVISDNRRQGLEALDRQRIESLVASHLDTVQTLVDELETLAASPAAFREDPPEMEKILETWHFSTSRRRQLRSHLRRWSVLLPEEPLPREEIEGLTSAREVLEHLEARLDRAALAAPF